MQANSQDVGPVGRSLLVLHERKEEEDKEEDKEDIEVNLPRASGM